MLKAWSVDWRHLGFQTFPCGGSCERPLFQELGCPSWERFFVGELGWRLDELFAMEEFEEADKYGVSGLRKEFSMPEVDDGVRIPQHSTTGGENAALHWRTGSLPPRSVVACVVDLIQTLL